MLEAIAADPGSRSTIEYWRGILELSRGNSSEAVARMSSSLEMLGPEVDPGRTGWAQIDCGLGTALARVGRTKEARSHLEQACPIFDRYSFEQPQLHQWSVDARRQLGI